MKKTVFAIALSGIWITFSEFLRNELLFKNVWVEHYKLLGLQFDTLPINGLLWAAWSFLLAFITFELIKALSFKKALVLSWVSAFLMMWIVGFNLQILPLQILIPATPLSIIEVLVAGIIIKKIEYKLQSR